MTTSTLNPKELPCKPVEKFSAISNEPEVFTKIYQENTHIAIWHRKLSDEFSGDINEFINSNTVRPTPLIVTPENTRALLSEKFGDDNIPSLLVDDIALLVDMFCCLLDLPHAGLRMSVLEQAMCPRFHVDRIPCRLVTTYQGVATQWLEHHHVERSKLGAGNEGKPDEESGLFNHIDDINQLNEGDVALLKGEYWYNNEGAGLVHRSPSVSNNERRLLLTLDVIVD